MPGSVECARNIEHFFLMAKRRTSRRKLKKVKDKNAGTVRLGAVLALLVAVNMYVFLFRAKTSLPAVAEKAAIVSKPLSKSMGLMAQWGGVGEISAEGASNSLAESAPDSFRWIAGEVQSGDSLGGILHREGVFPQTQAQVIRSLEGYVDFRKILAGQPYRIQFDTAGELQRFEYTISATESVVLRRMGDRLLAEKNSKQIDVKEEKIGGVITSSLYSSIKEQGENTALVAFFVDVFAYDVDFYNEQQKGDRFRIIVEKEYAEGKFLRYRRVIAAEYDGKVGTYRAFSWKPPGAKHHRYYDEKGRSVEKSLLKTPLKFTRISSKFNRRRMHPILHRARAHLGVDYAAPRGTPVRAAAAGKITRRGWCGGGGNCVRIGHKNGMSTVYMHLSKFQKGQALGQFVAQKTVIGYVGSTGRSTGPHLHFEVRQNGKAVDPLRMKMQRAEGVPKAIMARFKNDNRPLVDRLATIPTE